MISRYSALLCLVKMSLMSRELVGFKGASASRDDDGRVLLVMAGGSTMASLEGEG